jgi:hypothetical protein
MHPQSVFGAFKNPLLAWFSPLCLMGGWLGSNHKKMASAHANIFNLVQEEGHGGCIKWADALRGFTLLCENPQAIPAATVGF